MKRVELNAPDAMYNLACDYRDGDDGYPQNYAKALELIYRAEELGCSEAYFSIGYTYDYGEGVEVDSKKAVHYYELAAMGGDADARYHLGSIEKCSGNWKRAVKHYMIAAGTGDGDSVKGIQDMYSSGFATKEDYTKALRAYQSYLSEIKNRQRDQAAAFSDQYRYY